MSLLFTHSYPPLPSSFLLSLFSQRVLGCGCVNNIYVQVCGHLRCSAQCEGQGTTSRNWFSFCIMWVVVIWHQVSLPIEPSFQLFKVLPVCFPFDGCGTLPLNTVCMYPMHAGQYSTTDRAAFFSSAFVYLEKKKTILYLYSTCEKAWRNKTKAVVLSHSCPPVWPFFV